MTPKINQEFLCIKEYIMDNNEIAYSVGQKYKITEITNSKFFCMPSDLFNHEMSFDDEFFEHFELVEKNKTPKHYKNSNNYDVIDFVKDNDLNFNEGNVIKYVTRCRKKGTHLEDLKKALDYIQREIKYYEQL